MTFKELTNELLLQGWRAYYIDDGDLFTSYHRMQKMASLNNIELQVYEGKKIIFARTIFPVEEVKQPIDD